ncbi:MAG TPA: hypothetical protein PLJ21_12520, partial [Pseudobdellovibrionaceae bacterium]|nr:hypothetical protein [Pseudobdellovibrionaceae bacterium]
MDNLKKNQVHLDLDLDENLEEKLAWMFPEHGPYRILNLSIDARGRKKPHFKYSLELNPSGETLTQENFELEKISAPKTRPLIIGAGPCGLFAALRFVERGIKPILIERGSTCEERLKKINRYWRYGELDPHNNVCFGEGGAGMYSDGKLITRIKSPYIPYVLHRLVQMGAPEEIQWLSNPHVGSDRIRRLLPAFRKFLLDNGCEIHFETQFKKLLLSQNQVVGIEALDLKTQELKKYPSEHVILATGHSAMDIFETLHQQNVFMEPKSFAMGVRVEHPQELINQIQYREYADHPKLKSAPYKLTHHDHKTNTGVYSFCMCPGGYVLSSSTENDGVVCNGMSNYSRNGPFANAAVVVTIDHEKLFPGDLFGGIKLRTEIEQRAQNLVTRQGLKK